MRFQIIFLIFDFYLKFFLDFWQKTFLILMRERESAHLFFGGSRDYIHTQQLNSKILLKNRWREIPQCLHLQTSLFAWSFKISHMRMKRSSHFIVQPSETLSTPSLSSKVIPTLISIDCIPHDSTSYTLKKGKNSQHSFHYSCTCSILHLVVIALDRFVMLVWKLRSHYTRRRSKEGREKGRFAWYESKWKQPSLEVLTFIIL